MAEIAQWRSQIKIDDLSMTAEKGGVGLGSSTQTGINARRRSNILLGEGAGPLVTPEQAKLGAVKLQGEQDPLMQKYLMEGLIGLDPTALAHQLCIIDLSMLKEIRVHELMRTNWLKKDKDVVAAHVVNVVQWFNKFSRWVMSEICNWSDANQRALCIKFFLRVCEECRKYRNYNAIKAILAGFQSSPIFRLKQTWDLVAEKYIALRDELEELCQQQGNYKNLRAKIAEEQELNRKASVDSSIAPCPIIPYLGMILTDLTFGEEGNSDYVASEHYPIDTKVLFNLAKLTLMSKTVLQLRSYCTGSYPFAFDKSYHHLLCNLKVMGEEECYRRSKQYELPSN